MQQKNEREGMPIIATTIGDPAGIGPEVALKGALTIAPEGICRPLLVGSQAVIRSTLQTIPGLSGTTLAVVNDPAEVADATAPGQVAVLDTNNLAENGWVTGKLSREGGVAAAEDTETAVKLALDRTVAAVVSGPINKQGLQLAGRNYPGQTEFIRALTDAAPPLKILVGGSLRVAQLSSHMPLSEAVKHVTRDRIRDTSIRLSEALTDAWGIAHPHIAVSALNPHAGDNGLLGREEIEEIEPGVREAVSRGYDIVGPIPSDVAYMHGEEGRYDAVVSLFHDQGTLPLKRLKFASLAYGLPIIRTTPGHGTAYDIAGRGDADPSAMLNALRLASHLAAQKAAREAAGTTTGKADAGVSP